MLSVLVVLSLAQAPVSLAAPGVSVAGVDQRVADAAFEHFATMLGQTRGLKVSTAKDLQNVLGLERQRQLLSCNEGSSCIAEIAGSLGVDGLVTATLALVGSKYVTTIRVIRARDGSEAASASSRKGSLDEVTAWLETEAPLLGDRVLSAFGRAPAPRREGGGFVRFVPGLLGLVAGGVGAGLLIASNADRDALSAARVPVSEIDGVAQRGRTLQTAGWISVGAGAAAVAASAIWLIASPSNDGPPPVSVAPAQGGATLVLQGVFP